MSKNSFQDIAKEFSPPDETLISIRDIVKESRKTKTPITLRTLTYYATEGIIPKPLHIGKVAYYDHEFTGMNFQFKFTCLVK